MTTDLLLPWLNAAGQGGVRHSMQSFAGDGTTGPWEFNFAGGYINPAHVRAYRYDPDTAQTHPLTLTLIGSNQATSSEPIPNGQYIVLYRDTPKDTPLVDYTEGAVLDEKNLDTTTRQAVFAAAEMVDRFDTINATSGAALESSTAALAAANEAVSQAAAAVAAATAVNVDAAISAANQAVTVANAAVTTANTAAATANGIDAKASQAQSDAAAAAAAATTALTTVSSADAKATQALADAAGAAALADAASALADTASATASGAQAQSAAAETKATAALATALATSPMLVKPDYNQPCLTKLTATALCIRAGTALVVDGSLITFNTDTGVSLPTLQAGGDYSVLVKPDGTAVAVKDMFASPASPPVAAARKIGGFHFGLVVNGTTPAAGGFATASGTGSAAGGMHWTQESINDIAGINKYSLWDMAFRSAGEQHGFVFDPRTRVWVAIYLCGKTHDTDGISAYSCPVASGTALPRIAQAYRNGTTEQFYNCLTGEVAAEIAASHGARLPRAAEFFSAAYGVTEGQSLGGAAVTIALTKREPGYTSRIGLEQASGHLWVWGEMGESYGAGDWYTVPSGRGDRIDIPVTSRYGGGRDAGTRSGSRALSGGNAATYSQWSTGLRAVCEHLQLAL